MAHNSGFEMPQPNMVGIRRERLNRLREREQPLSEIRPGGWWVPSESVRKHNRETWEEAETQGNSCHEQ